MKRTPRVRAWERDWSVGERERHNREREKDSKTERVEKRVRVHALPCRKLA